MKFKAITLFAALFLAMRTVLGALAFTRVGPSMALTVSVLADGTLSWFLFHLFLRQLKYKQ